MVMPRDPAPAPDDDRLLALYAGGDARVAGMLSDRHLPRVFGLAVRMLGDAAEAEDVAQEAMVKLWQIAPKWQPGRAKVSTWLYRVTANLCTDRLRRRRGRGLDQVPEPIDETPGAEARLIAADRARALQAALAGLPERQRTAMVLRHFEGLGNPAIAEVLQTSTEAVESLLARGRRALAALLAPERARLGLED
jgi:RNA polymerase sigma factor (sigma-70 family)